MKKLGYSPASFIIPQHRNGTGSVVQILLHCRSVNTLYWKIIKSPQFGVTLYFQSVSAAASAASTMHDDVIKWKHFLRYLPFVWGIHHWPVNSPHKGQWCGALMFSLCCAWINSWVNNREAGDLRRQHTHYDGIVMVCHCKDFCLPLENRLCHIWDKEYIGLRKCTGWPFYDLDPRSQLWHRLTKICFSARKNKNHSSKLY